MHFELFFSEVKLKKVSQVYSHLESDSFPMLTESGYLSILLYVTVY